MAEYRAKRIHLLAVLCWLSSNVLSDCGPFPDRNPSITCPNDISLQACAATVVNWSEPAYLPNPAIATGYNLGSRTPKSDNDNISPWTSSCVAGVNCGGGTINRVGTEFYRDTFWCPPPFSLNLDRNARWISSTAETGIDSTFHSLTLTLDRDNFDWSSATIDMASIVDNFIFPLDLGFGTSTITCGSTTIGSIPPSFFETASCIPQSWPPITSSNCPDMNGATGSFDIVVGIGNNDFIAAAQLYMSANPQVRTPLVGFTDNCGIPSVSRSGPAPGDLLFGSSSVSYAVTDSSGRRATCSFAVFVGDTIAPTPVCNDVIYQLTSTAPVTIRESELLVGSFDSCGFTANISPNFVSCAQRSASVTAALMDPSGNSASCTATVTGTPREPHTLQCQDTTVTLTGFSATIDVASVTVGSTGSCVTSRRLSQSVFDCTQAGTTQAVFIESIEEGGTTLTCTISVTVVDGSAPSVTCNPTTVTLDPFGSAPFPDSIVTATDNCDVPIVSTNPTTADCSFVGGRNVGVTISDSSGNLSTCQALVTASDVTPPTVSCTDITVTLSGPSEPVSFAMVASAVDSCGVDATTAQLDITSVSCIDAPSTTALASVADFSRNIGSCVATITVASPPTAVCNRQTVFIDGSGAGTLDVNEFLRGSIDTCGAVPSLSASRTTFTCSDVGSMVTVTGTAMSGSLVDTCTATVTVVDSEVPVVLCRDISVTLDSTGNLSLDPANLVSSATDNCGIPSVTTPTIRLNCADVSSTPVTIGVSVVDSSGNIGTCNSQVTVDAALTATCAPTPPTVFLSSSSTVPIDADTVGTATDVCGTATRTISPSFATCSDALAGSMVVTVTATSPTDSDTCDTTVTVVDTETPTLTCLTPTVNVGTGTGTATFSPPSAFTVSDLCPTTDSVSPTSFTCGDLGPVPFTGTAVDPSGNIGRCTGTVNVVDLDPPTAVCATPPDIDVGASDALLDPASILSASVDVCGIASFGVSPSSFTCLDLGPGTVTGTVQDATGNSAQCTASINVIDSVNPTARCNALTIDLAVSNPSTIDASLFTAGSTDRCGIRSVSLDLTQVTCAELGANTVTAQVVDGFGNFATCSETVTVVDSSTPSAVCNSLVVQLDSIGFGALDVAAFLDGSSGPCGIASQTVDRAVFGCSDLLNPVVVNGRIEAVSGGFDTCTALVTVVDRIAPTAVCSPQTVVLDSAGGGTASSAAATAMSSDNCGISARSLSRSTFSCSDVLTSPNMVIATVTDGGFNVDSCNLSVDVIDDTLPSALCRDFVFQISGQTLTLPPAAIDDGSNDACGVSLSVSPNVFGPSDVGDVSVTLTAIDPSGNQDTCTALVTIISAILKGPYFETVFMYFPITIEWNVSVGVFGPNALVQLFFVDVTDNFTRTVAENIDYTLGIYEFEGFSRVLPDRDYELYISVNGAVQVDFITYTVILPPTVSA